MNAEGLKAVLNGAQLTLVDESVVEQFYFSGEGDSVAATLGLRDGAVCGPVLRYRVTDDGAVELGDGGVFHFRWEEAEYANGILNVVSDGRAKRFQVVLSKKRERYLP